MIEEAFQYPTRLGRAAELPGGPFLLPADWRKKEPPGAAPRGPNGWDIGKLPDIMVHPLRTSCP